MMQTRVAAWISACVLASFSLLLAFSVSAQTAADLQSKIGQRAEDIKALEKEIAGYQKQLDEIGTQVSSLSATVKSLQLTQKKLEADIKVTENKIVEKNIQIQLLSSQISDKQETISDDRRIIARSYVSVNELGSRSLPELLLSEKSLSAAWGSLDSIAAVQKGLVDRIASLENAKANLEVNKKATEKAKAELLSLNSQLKDQRSVVLGTANQQKQLLDDTKQSEAKYQAMLAQKKNLKELFEREVLDLESQLKLTIDPASIPHTGSGVLSWPLDAITVTQYFGNTPFATANSQIYNGKGHTGVDFRASIGTPIKASLSGTVVGVANTDIIPSCYSYGKWIMIKHGNGLSTLYAHLSLQSVSVGQQVVTGQIIGYSGNTGYTTGPHLHYGVYATEGIRITKLAPGMSKNCSGATIPLADFKAYLNPLSYL
ncbi:MAG: peptidoglycan DD-metalloendopeptidase family protein [Patescibacteria group bacterium]